MYEQHLEVFRFVCVCVCVAAGECVNLCGCGSGCLRGLVCVWLRLLESVIRREKRR